MSMLLMITWAAVGLLSVTVVLALLAVANRCVSDLREARLQELRSRMQKNINDFLAGSTSIKHVLQSLVVNRGMALNVLIDTVSRMPAGQRRRLLVFFTHFQFAQEEIAALRSRIWSRRASAASRLGYMDSHEAIDSLVHALNDDLLDVRLAAAYSLAQLQVQEAVIPILQSLALPGAWPLQRAAEILFQMGDAATVPLRSHLDSRAPNIGEAAVALKVLGMLRDARAVPSMVRYLKNPDTELRICSAKSLGQVGDARAVPPLCASLDDAAWEVRSAAASALGELGDLSAIPTLSRKLADPAWWVRFNAAEALYKLSGDGRAALESAMQNHRDRFAHDISRQVLEEHGSMKMPEMQLT